VLREIQIFEVGEVELSDFSLLVELCELGVGEMSEISSEKSFSEKAIELSSTCRLGVDDDSSFEVNVVLRGGCPVSSDMRSYAHCLSNNIQLSCKKFSIFNKEGLISYNKLILIKVSFSDHPSMLSLHLC
jgi:hypothetical protein